jgi:hypothetical protein
MPSGGNTGAKSPMGALIPIVTWRGGQ